MCNNVEYVEQIPYRGCRTLEHIRILPYIVYVYVRPIIEARKTCKRRNTRSNTRSPDFWRSITASKKGVQ